MHQAVLGKGRDFNDESTCDVVFLVGRNPDICRFTAHRTVLEKGTPVLKALFTFSNEPHGVIKIEDVDSRSFDYLLRFLYGKQIVLQTYWTALALLYTAHKYLVPGLVEICVKFLALNLTEKSVLEIYQHARRYCCPNEPTLQPSLEKYLPSAPPDPDLFTPSHRSKDEKIVTCTESLLLQCEQYIDKNADKVFQTEQIEDLDASTLSSILSRDSLDITNELILFHALQQWSLVECRRKQLPVTPKNRRKVLGDILYLIRFGLLSSKDFLTGPNESDLFSREELRFLSSLVTSPGVELPFVPETLRPFAHRFSQPRSKYLVADPPWSLRGITWKRSSKSKDPKPKLERSVSLDSGKSCAAKNWAANACVDLLLCLFD